MSVCRCEHGEVKRCKQTQKYVLMSATSSAVSSLRSCLCVLARNSHDSSLDASLCDIWVVIVCRLRVWRVVAATDNCVESQ